MKTPILLLAVLLTACGPSQPPAITVGPVTFQEQQLLGLPAAARRTLANLTAFALAVSDSTTDALVAPVLQRQQNDSLLEVLGADLVLDQRDVSDAVLKARYMTDPAYELTVRHILFLCARWRSPAEHAAAKAKAEKALALVKAGADFGKTAARLSQEPGAAASEGLLKPGRKGAWVDPFWNAASALKVGEISPVVETRYGYHIIKLENRTVVPFTEERSGVALDLAREIGDPQATLDAWLDSAGARVRVSDEGLTAAAAPTAPDTTILARWPGGTLTLKQYLSWAAGHPTSWNAGGRGTDPRRFRASVEQLARRRMALEEASRRGARVPSAEVEAMDRAWADSTYQWSASLDFAYGVPPDQVAREALAALGNTGQQAGLVRTSIDQHAPLLAARYEIVVKGETPSGGQP